MQTLGGKARATSVPGASRQSLRSSCFTSSRHANTLGMIGARPAVSFSAPPLSGSRTMQQSQCAAMPAWYTDTAVGGDLPEQYADFFPAPGRQRRGGVLLHPTSLPGNYGSGELGVESMKAIDWMASAGLQVWQVLPIGPPDSFFSPYSGTDANTGNPMLISIDELIREGFLESSEAPPHVPIGPVDFTAVGAVKLPLLKKAAGRIVNNAKFAGLRKELAAWRAANPWLESSAVFDVAQHQPGLDDCAWWDWPEDLRFREPAAIAAFRAKYAAEVEEFVAVQFIFERQWKAVRAYANSKNIKIVGDMPIYIGAHSADVWSNPSLFELDPSGAPSLVSGVPPDAFSDDGQKWGSPVFKWPAHKAEGYRWWVQRVNRALALYDETRIDHFRGFAGYWGVPSEAPTALTGSWKKGPGMDLFDALKAQCWPTGEAPILAEDLGVITGDVIELRDTVGSPGMVVLQFAWGGGGANPHLPHNHALNSFCYPGTHDNETTAGWIKDSATPGDKETLQAYLHSSDLSDVAWDFIRLGYQSVSYTTVVALQDIMRLDNKARMNQPGTTVGNWSWRVGGSDVWGTLETEAKDLAKLAALCNRVVLCKSTKIKKP